MAKKIREIELVYLKKEFQKFFLKENMDCTVCGSANAKKCSACGSVAYCCINCQRKDWSKHKFSCKSWKVTTDEENPQFGR